MRVLYCVGDEKKQQTDNIIGWCCVRGNMDNNGKYIELRSRYLRFVYKAYHWSVEDAGLRVWFDFEMGDVEFHPTALVERKCLDALEQANTQTINDIVFNIGMVELVSYWKCACPPEVEVQCGTLTDEQRDFWLKLYWNGLGEFYYTNGINESREEFMRVRRVESGEWRVESGERRVESGEWRAESGEWRVESGEWRVESGEWRGLSGADWWGEGQCGDAGAVAEGREEDTSADYESSRCHYRVRPRGGFHDGRGTGYTSYHRPQVA